VDTRQIRLTERDRMILAFAAEHRLVLGRQIEALSGADVSGRMRALVRGAYLGELREVSFPCYQILKRGLRAIGSPLKPPRPKLDAYKHDVGLAWLWLGARRGAFGPLQHVLSERRLRSEDGALEHPPDPHAVRLGGIDRYGNETLHYPDLLLIDGRRRRLAVELELTQKSRGRLERILAGYAADGRIDRVLYLVEDNREGRRLGHVLAGTVQDMGLSGRVYVQRIEPIRSSPDGASSAPRRAAARLQESDRAGVGR
jgi:hypothetical protein